MDDHIEKAMQVLALVVIGSALAAGLGAVALVMLRKAETMLKIWAALQGIGGGWGNVGNIGGGIGNIIGGLGDKLGGWLGGWGAGWR